MEQISTLDPSRDGREHGRLWYLLFVRRGKNDFARHIESSTFQNWNGSILIRANRREIFTMVPSRFQERTAFPAK
jgi:hypothetical protein